jgi:hypothetical protein
MDRFVGGGWTFLASGWDTEDAMSIQTWKNVTSSWTLLFRRLVPTALNVMTRWIILDLGYYAALVVATRKLPAALARRRSRGGGRNERPRRSWTGNSPYVCRDRAAVRFLRTCAGLPAAVLCRRP